MILESAATSHPFLADLKGEHLKILADSACRAHFQKDEIIFRKGEMANRFYLITKGRVLLDLSAKTWNSNHVQEVADGDVLGWSWLFPPYYWHCDARAAETTDAIFFYGTRLREQFEQNRDFGHQLMRRVAAVVIKRLKPLRQLPFAPRAFL